MKGIAELRVDYSKASLDSKDVNKNPFVQFEKWFNDAATAKVPEPNAFTLSTITESGRPSARIVLLKGVEQDQFTFYTNFQSQKGQDLENNPSCAMTFFWPELERQIRIQGTAKRIEESTSEAYFKSRPRGSQIGAWSSPQSSVIANREILEARQLEMEKKFAGMETLPKPKQWGGFAITPHEFEFWQGRPSRLHDRIAYCWVDKKWEIHRLAP
jgi:pyridoxamine 5'-phosphate oxidase